MDGDRMDEGKEQDEELILAHGQDPYEAEGSLSFSQGADHEGIEEEDDEDMDAEDVFPTDPDVEWYLNLYDLTDAQRVSICRTYASYLVAKGKSGVMQPGPPSELKKQARRQGRFAP